MKKKLSTEELFNIITSKITKNLESTKLRYK